GVLDFEHPPVGRIRPPGFHPGEWLRARRLLVNRPTRLRSRGWASELPPRAAPPQPPPAALRGDVHVGDRQLARGRRAPGRRLRTAPGRPVRPAALLPSGRPLSHGHWVDLGEGYHAVRNSRALMCVLVAWSTAAFSGGFMNVAEIFLAKRAYSAGDFGFGLLWAGTGVGMVIGGLAASELIKRDLGAAYVRFLALFAIGIACAAAAPDVWVGACAMIVAGIGN